MIFFFFFFQAEDGIRDFCLSRGLGDVYKRQILAAYKDFEDRVALVETKLPALEMVRRANKNRIGRFKKQDIRELCPTLSDSSIESALRKLVAAGELKKEGKGKNTCYFRLN